MPFRTENQNKCLYLTEWTHKLWLQTPTDLRKPAGQICLLYPCGGSSVNLYITWRTSTLSQSAYHLSSTIGFNSILNMVYLRFNMPQYFEKKRCYWSSGGNGGRTVLTWYDGYKLPLLIILSHMCTPHPPPPPNQPKGSISVMCPCLTV
jgi:hypothetical protein